MKNYLTRRNHHSELDLFDDAFNDFFRPMFYNVDLDNMRTDIKETENEYELDVEMPGFNKEDISVSLNDGYITVSAKKDEKETSENGRYIRKERSYSCQRSYYVGEVKESDISAKYDNGVLKLTVPKCEDKLPEINRIRIE